MVFNPFLIVIRCQRAIQNKSILLHNVLIQQKPLHFTIIYLGPDVKFYTKPKKKQKWTKEHDCIQMKINLSLVHLQHRPQTERPQQR